MEGEIEFQEALSIYRSNNCRVTPPAIALLETAAKLGNADAQNFLGGCYLEGDGVEVDEEKGKYWLRKAVEDGNHVLAHLNLSVLLSSQLDAKHEPLSTEERDDKEKEVLKLVQFAAQEGSPEAQYKLSTIYEQGSLGCGVDDTQALFWITKAAENGMAPAQHNLGCRYSIGKGVAQDDEKAVQWYSQAAEQSHPLSFLSLGTCYLNGKGIEKDEATGVALILKAADEFDNADAQFTLAQLYDNGIGVKEDHTLAIRWARRAAEQGHAIAQYNMGVCYESGAENVGKDEREAARWYAKAACQGHLDSQFNLGEMYRIGRGVKKDVVQAARFYKLARHGGELDSAFILEMCWNEEKKTWTDPSPDLLSAWEKKALTLKDAQAAYNLYVCIRDSLGIEKDEEKEEQMREIAESGSVDRGRLVY